MKSEHRSLLAIALSAGFFILWFVVINPMLPKSKAQAIAPAPAAVEQPAAPAIVEKPAEQRQVADVTDQKADPQSNLEAKQWSVETDLVKIDFTSDGGVATSWQMKGYNTETAKTSPLVDLAIAKDGVARALSLSFENADFDFPDSPRYEMIAAESNQVSYRWKSSYVDVVKTIKVDPKDYNAEVMVEIKNVGNRAIKGKPTLKWGQLNVPAEGGFLSFGKQPPVHSYTPLYYIDGKTQREANVARLGTRNEKIGSVYWAGLESRYFLSAILPRNQGDGLLAEYGANPVEDEKKGTTAVWAGTALPQFVLPPGQSSKATFSLYVGPKDINQLKAVGMRLEDAIDYGWFTIIAIPILYLLRFFYGLIHNYGIAIILLTIFVKLLLHPINVKSLKSMKAMQQIQPRLKEIQKKYKDDKQRLNQETMQLFRAHKVNPMGGCLPMAAQFPIYIALYKVLWNSIELYHAPFFWFYRDLSAPDPYFITPIILGIFMVAQQKLMPSTSADPSQQKMMMMMPIMFSVFMLFLPVGLVIYILVNTAMSVTQQWLYNKGIRGRDLIRGKWQPKLT